MYWSAVEELEAMGFTVVVGTDQRDVIRLTGGDRFLVVTFSGNDWVRTGSGNDVVRTGDGNDTIRTGAGDDLALGGDGRDLVSGQAGENDLRGEAGNDHLFGGDDNDLLVGGAGNDRIYAHGGDDDVAGDEGNDRLYGGAGNYNMAGGPGFDRCNGGSGSNTSDGTCEVTSPDLRRRRTLSPTRTTAELSRIWSYSRPMTGRPRRETRRVDPEENLPWVAGSGSAPDQDSVAHNWHGSRALIPGIDTR